MPATEHTPIAIEDRKIPGPHGDVPIRTYLPDAPTVGLVWVHGGAFSFGDLDGAESDWVAQQLAGRGIAVIAVDYQLAPVQPWAAEATGVPAREGVHFPVPSLEVGAAFAWAMESAEFPTVRRWSFGGASAGANLVAGATLRLRDEGAPLPASLLLTYGLFHAALPPLSAELAAKYAAQPLEHQVFSPELVHLMNVNYVGDSTHLATSYAFPGGHDLEGLPPTFLLNNDVDSLRASGDLFGSELARAGVDVAVVRESGTTHGHLGDPENLAAARSIQRMIAWLTSDLIAPVPRT